MTAPLSLLIVDDNEMEGRLLGGVLRDAFANAKLKVVNEPLEALEYCAQEHVDCALIDFNMPRLNGLELGGRMQRELRYLPMVLMTAVGDELLAADAIRSGFADYIPKSKLSRDSAMRTVTRAMRSIEQARVIDEQREELEHFAYALSHDFKQPIRQIRTFSEILGEQIGAAEDGEVSRNLTFLRDAARRLGALVDVMSQYTLLNKPPVLKMVEMGDVIQGVRENLSGFLEETGGVLIAEPAPSVYGNEALLAQILQNLVVNGLRYNKSVNPRVTIRFDDVGADRIVVRVSDNGIGIEDKYIDTIFKPLMRLHNASEFPGTGLGLTITRKAAVALGGEIRCESEPGRGSQFFVELFRTPPEARATEGRSVEAAA